MHNLALVVGCASGVWEEVNAAKQRYTFDCIIAVNNAGVNLFPLDHWVSFHIELFPHWIELRRQAGHSLVTSFWTSQYRGAPVSLRSDFPIQRIMCNGGSSGLIGAIVATKLAHKAILAGIPMEPERAHFDKPGAWAEAVDHRKAWEENLPLLKGRVTSLSGWTKTLLEGSDEARLVS